MVARSVTRVWQSSLNQPPSVGKVYQSQSSGAALPNAPSSEAAPVSRAVNQGQHEPPEKLPPSGEGFDDPKISLANPMSIVPKRRAVGGRASSSEAPFPEPSETNVSLMNSPEFWKGTVLGAGIVLLIKTLIAVKAPYGVDWYGF